MSLFQDANIIMQAALHAALPDTAVEKALKELPRYSGKLVLIAAGKAAWQMAHAAYTQLGAKIDSGVVITKHGHAMGPIGPLDIREAGHPVPDEDSYTATAAAIITGMLGGSVAFLAAYAFLSNLAIVVLAPLVLPLIATGQIDTPFLETMSNVFMRVGPTMLFPLLAAWLIQYAAPKVNAVLLRWGILAYYLWAGMLVILMGGTFEQLLKPGEKDYQLEIFLALTGIAVCTANFILGKSIGSRFHRRIAGGQALAQKNIILPMWLTFQYLDPIASVSLAAYSIFQNIVNAAQIWLKGRRDDRIIQRLHDFHEKKHARIQAAQQLVPQEEHAELLSELPTRVKDRLKK
mgnify:CR=1 FL=1